MSILRRQFCTFSELRRRKKWTAKFCPKQWLTPIKSPLEEKRKRKQSKLKKISRRERGDNRFEFHVVVQQSISMKATADLSPERETKTRQPSDSSRYVSPLGQGERYWVEGSWDPYNK